MPRALSMSAGIKGAPRPAQTLQHPDKVRTPISLPDKPEVGNFMLQIVQESPNFLSSPIIPWHPDTCPNKYSIWTLKSHIPGCFSTPTAETTYPMVAWAVGKVTVHRASSWSCRAEEGAIFLNEGFEVTDACSFRKPPALFSEPLPGPWLAALPILPRAKTFSSHCMDLPHRWNCAGQVCR